MKRKKRQKPTSKSSKEHSKAPNRNSIIIHPDAYARLDLIHQLAVDARLYNMSYRSIASHINAYIATHSASKSADTYQEASIRGWFESGGICYDALQQKKAQRAAERAERKSELDNQIMDALVDAVAQLRAKIEKGNLQAVAELFKIAPVNPKEPPKDTSTIIHFYIPNNGR